MRISAGPGQEMIVSLTVEGAMQALVSLTKVVGELTGQDVDGMMSEAMNQAQGGAGGRGGNVGLPSDLGAGGGGGPPI